MKKELVDKLSILLRKTPEQDKKDFFMDVANCFKEIKKYIPDDRWNYLWKIYQTQVYGENNLFKRNSVIIELDDKIYEITGIKTPLMETLEKFAEIVGAKR